MYVQCIQWHSQGCQACQGRAHALCPTWGAKLTILICRTVWGGGIPGVGRGGGQPGAPIVVLVQVPQSLAKPLPISKLQLTHLDLELLIHDFSSFSPLFLQASGVVFLSRRRHCVPDRFGFQYFFHVLFFVTGK